MSGRWVRRIEDRPGRCECQPPKQARAGDIWQCDCGRRYRCLDDTTQHGNMVTLEANWRRRYWPWPRLRQPIPVGDPILDVDPSAIDALLNGARDRSSAREVRKR